MARVRGMHWQATMVGVLRRVLFAVIGGYLLSVAVAPAPANAGPARTTLPKGAQAEVLDVEDKRFRAQLDRDAATLALLIDDEAHFGHASGYNQNKAEFIETVASGRLAYGSIVVLQRSAFVRGQVAAVHGVLELAVAGKTTVNSYLAVYVRNKGQWRLHDWQSGAGPRQTGASQ